MWIADVVEHATVDNKYTFADEWQLHIWARPGPGFFQHFVILLGTGQSRFSRINGALQLLRIVPVQAL